MAKVREFLSVHLVDNLASEQLKPGSNVCSCRKFSTNADTDWKDRAGGLPKQG